MIKEKIIENGPTLLMSSGSIGIIQLIGSIPIHEIIQVGTQVIIGIVTLIKLFKGKKTKVDESSD